MSKLLELKGLKRWHFIWIFFQRQVMGKKWMPEANFGHEHMTLTAPVNQVGLSSAKVLYRSRWAYPLAPGPLTLCKPDIFTVFASVTYSKVSLSLGFHWYLHFSFSLPPYSYLSLLLQLPAIANDMSWETVNSALIQSCLSFDKLFTQSVISIKTQHSFKKYKWRSHT